MIGTRSNSPYLGLILKSIKCTSLNTHDTCSNLFPPGEPLVQWHVCVSQWLSGTHVRTYTHTYIQHHHCYPSHVPCSQLCNVFSSTLWCNSSGDASWRGMLRHRGVDEAAAGARPDLSVGANIWEQRGNHGMLQSPPTLPNMGIVFHAQWGSKICECSRWRLACSCSVTVFMQCDVVHAVWCCSCSVTMFMQCDNVHAVWHCSCSVTLFMRCDNVYAVWHCSNSVTLSIQCDNVYVVWPCSCSVTLFMQCDIVRTVWQCLCSVTLFKQCDIVHTVWQCLCSVTLFMQCDVVHAVWHCPYSVTMWRCSYSDTACQSVTVL